MTKLIPPPQGARNRQNFVHSDDGRCWPEIKALLTDTPQSLKELQIPWPWGLRSLQAGLAYAVYHNLCEVTHKRINGSRSNMLYTRKKGNVSGTT